MGMLDWRRIEEAPFEEDVELFVTDRCGSYYPLRDTCRYTAEGWVSSATGANIGGDSLRPYFSVIRRPFYRTFDK